MRQVPVYQADKPGIAERKELSIMLIYIEMYSGDRLLNGPKCSVSELKKRLAKILAEAETKDFISIFCARYNFEELSLGNASVNENIEVDYYIDIDAALVMAPAYYSSRNNENE